MGVPSVASKLVTHKQTTEQARSLADTPYDLLLCFCGHEAHECAWPTVDVQTGETLRKASLGSPPLQFLMRQLS